MRCLFESVHHDYSKRCRIINAWHAEGAQWTLTGEPSHSQALSTLSTTLDIAGPCSSRLRRMRMHRLTAASSAA